jgi:hypothetical protein
MPELQCRVEHGVAVLSLEAVPLVARNALAALRRARCRSAVFDLEGIPPDPSLAKSLLTLRREILKKRGRLVLCALAAETKDFLASTWLLNLFEVRADVAGALACLNGRKHHPPEAPHRNGVAAHPQKKLRKS